MRRVLTIIFFLISIEAFCQPSKQVSTDKKFEGYLFTYFTGNAKKDEAIKFAISPDGYNWIALNNNKPILESKDISSTGGVRDPHILRSPDGNSFFMVATDMVSGLGWNSNRAMVLLKSTNLVDWTSSVVNIRKRFKGHDNLLRVWAPQTIYDPARKKYMIYFSMKHGDEPDKIYYAYANADFTDLETEPKQLYFSPSNGACIDGDIVYKGEKYYLFFKTEDAGAGIKVAVSDRLTEGYVEQKEYVQQTKDPVEGAGTFKLNDGSGYILMYDVYTKGRYQFTKTTDFKTFDVIDRNISMNFHPRHGTILPVTSEEVLRLAKKWLDPEDLIGMVTGDKIKQQNVYYDSALRNLTIPVKSEFKGKNIELIFPKFPGITVSPADEKKSSKGTGAYEVRVDGTEPFKFSVSQVDYKNPVLDGFYADPDILYSNKEKKFYLYPTSDGFIGWSGTYFKAFSSEDLVNWKDEGVILDLEKDVTWAKRNAWAPCIIEKKINDEYKYFYYYTAAQKIGVAVSDSPLGLFADSGKPLISERPVGISGGQEIDPDVFTDPRTGKSYLFWGNGYMAGAELNEDMISIKKETTTVLTPDESYREGTHIFYRNGRYYFLWSEDDTRSQNYKVRYGFADSPLGKITVPKNNVVIAKSLDKGIFATGHNSTIQVPGKDEWFIVYHRFNYPNGIAMGDAAGFNREVCIDQLKFDTSGNIIEVVPTHEGIRP